MRAWLLLLAVLATFKPIVQVASTEDITSRFIQAISTPTTIEQQKQVFVDWNEGEGVARYENVKRQRNIFNIQPETKQQLQTESKRITTNNATTTTALSPVIDITSLSVTKTRKSANKTRSTKPTSSSNTTSIAAIFSYKSSSDSVTYNNNNLIKISVKDNKRNKSEKANNSEVRQRTQSYKQNKNKFENFNEVNEKSAKNIATIKTNNNIVRTQEQQQLQQQQSNKVQHLEDTSNTIKQIEKTRRTKNTNTLEAFNIVNSEIEEAAENESFNKMAINDNTIEMREQISKRQRHHKQQQRKHHLQHKQHKQQQQRTQEQSPQHKNIYAAEELSATAERLANVTDETTATINSVTHIEAAERLAQASALALDNARQTDASSSTTTHNEVSSSAENDSELEPATYSNKEIIGEKLKPDPSTLVQIENSLLSLFNMKRPPKIDRSKIIIPEAMKQLYAQIMGHDWDTVMTAPRPSILSRSANTVRSFTHIESKIDDRFPHHHRFRLYFDVKSIPTEEKLRAAELQLTRDAISDAVLSERLANRTRYQVLAYDITRVGIRGKRDPSLKLLDNKTVRLNSTETVSLNVQTAVNRWLATPKKNYGILIEVRTTPALKPAPHQHVRLRRSLDEPHDSWQHKQPVLYAYTDDGKHKTRTIRDTSTRSKRAGHHRRGHRRKNSDEICRRHSLYVDFADVGWSDWIVAPPGYDAFYCQGKCPFPLAEHMNSTNHAVVQTLVNNLNPGKVPKACCVPTQLEGISMLYLNDQNTVVLKNYQDMTVVGCGCR